MNDHDDGCFFYVFAFAMLAGLVTWAVIVWAAVQVVRHLTGGA
jgi:hypothetical protein